MKITVKGVRKVISLLVVLALLVPLTGQVTVMPASAVTQAEIDDLKDEAAELDSQGYPGRQEQGPGTEEPAGAAD